MALRARLSVIGALVVLVLMIGSLATASRAGAAPPAEWSKSVCGAINTWVNGVNKASEATAQSPPKSATDAKKKLTKLLTTTQRRTEALLGQLRDAGPPDVKGGKQIAATMREGFAQVRRSVAQARRVLAQSSTNPDAFATAARSAQDAVEAGLEGIQAAFSAARTVDVAPLVEAFAKTPACRNVAA